MRIIEMGYTPIMSLNCLKWTQSLMIPFSTFIEQHELQREKLITILTFSWPAWFSWQSFQSSFCCQVTYQWPWSSWYLLSTCLSNSWLWNNGYRNYTSRTVRIISPWLCLLFGGHPLAVLMHSLEYYHFYPSSLKCQYLQLQLANIKTQDNDKQKIVSKS